MSALDDDVKLVRRYIQAKPQLRQRTGRPDVEAALGRIVEAVHIGFPTPYSLAAPPSPEQEQRLQAKARVRHEVVE